MRPGATAALPGLAYIASVANVDPGNFATNILGGTQFRYTLIAQQVIALGALPGQHAAARARVCFVGKKKHLNGAIPMDISVNAKVVCTDGLAGHSACVILNPISRRVTHLVVKEMWFPHVERLVPIELVTESTPHEIHLRCAAKNLTELDSFTETEFIQSEDPYHIYDMEEYRLWPYVLPEDEMMMPIEYEQVPHGQLAIHRGAHVRAKDGYVGRVDEFLVDPTNMRISHLVLREGHLWGQKDVTIPVSEIQRIEEDTVYLKLDKQGIEELPGIPVRRWREGLLGD
jgi:sporulation protein YlmC with PRC-barrel domain